MAAVDRDAEEPGSHRRPAQLGQADVRAQEGLLHDIGGVRLVAEKSKGHGVQLVLMTRDDGRERVAIAVPGPFEEGRVVHLTHSTPDPPLQFPPVGFSAVRRIREQIEIDAPVESVWRIVHRDIAKVPRWSKNLLRTEVVGGGSLHVGSELLYVVKLPGGLTQDIHLNVLEYDEHRRCGGSLTAASISGTWLWTYRSRGEVTVVTYETEVKLTGRERKASGDTSLAELISWLRV